MAWNEPGNNNAGNGNNNDPWGNKNKNGGRRDGPPDLDEVLKGLFGKFLGGSGGGRNTGGRSSGGGSPGLIIGVIAVVVLIFYFFKGVGIVNEQERAVVLRFGEFHDTIGPGFRWNPPLIDDVFTVNVTQVRSWSATEQMLTKDLNIVDIKLSVQYVIESAKDFVLNVKAPEESLQQAGNSALRHVVGSNPMHQVLTEGRSEVAVEVEDRLQAYLTSYTTGIEIEKVNIEDTNPPRQVQDAFDDVIRAREDEERYKNQAQAYANEIVPKARGTAQKMLEEAKAYREQVVARAEGEAQRFSALLTEYEKAPKVTRERLYLDALESVFANSSKIVIDVEGGNNMMYLPLDKLIEEGNKSASRRQVGGATTNNVDIDAIADRILDRINSRQRNNSNARTRESR